MRQYLVAIVLLAACMGPADSSPPAVPQGFTATAGNASVALGWQPNPEPDVQQYLLHWGSSAARQNALLTLPKEPSRFELTGLENGQSYFFTLEAIDTSNNASGPTPVVSATPVAADTTPPQLVGSIPLQNATNVALDVQIQLEFSEAMDPQSVSVQSGNLSLSHAQWNPEKTKVRFETPVLLSDTRYVLNVLGEDPAGNDLSGSTTLQFSSLETPAVVQGSFPANHASGVLPGSKIALQFSKSMNRSSVESAWSSAPATECAWEWSHLDQVATCTPKAPLALSTPYQMGLSTNARSASGVALAGAFTLNFSTQADTTKPTVLSLSPPNNQTGVSVKTPLLFRFSEAMEVSSIQEAFQSQPPIRCTWTWPDDRTAQCQPVLLEQYTTYTLAMGVGAKDKAGNPLQAAFGQTFVTGNAAPRVTQVSPNASTRVPEPINRQIVLTFSEPMNKATTESAFEVRVGSTLKLGTLSWNADCNLLAVCTQLTYTPGSNYPYAASVTWRVNTSATDMGDNTPMESSVNGGFETEVVIIRP